MRSKYFFNFFLGLSILIMSILAYGASQNINQSASDAAITMKVKGKYAENPLLKVFDIHVKTENDVVILSGEVDSDTQYEQAVVLAENTENVKGVNSDYLKIKSSQHPISDTLITAKVKVALLKNDLVRGETETTPWPIHVETKDGVVYLTGVVDTLQQKESTIKKVKLVEGVKSVKADLHAKNKAL